MYPDLKRKRFWKKLGIALVGFFLLVFILLKLSAPLQKNGLLSRVAAPVWRTEGALMDMVSNSLSYFSSKRNMSHDNRDLRERIEELELSLIDYDLVKNENKELRSFLGRSEGRKFVLGDVLVAPYKTLYGTMIVDVGSSEGVEKGDVVYAHELVRIGEVESVSKNQSRVKLYSSSEEKTKAILMPGETPIEIIGRGGGNYYFELSRDIGVRVGDTVISSEGNRSFYGQIEEIEETSDEVTAQYYFRSPVNFDTLRFVYIEE